MNKFVSLLFILILLFTSSCQNTPTIEQATVTSVPADTLTPIPPTITIEPSATIEPSPTAIAYPEILQNNFSDISVIYRDDFKYQMAGMSPTGWESSDDGAVLRIGKENNLRITPKPNLYGGVFNFNNEIINSGEGVFFSFKYTDMATSFTWGIDKLNEQGQLIEYKTDGYYSFALEINNKTRTTHTIDGITQKDDYIEGNIRLLENTWYNFVLAIDKDKNYIIMIWEPDNPENKLLYTKSLPESPDKYYFISWIGQNQDLTMDEFTIFQFDEFIK